MKVYTIIGGVNGTGKSSLTGVLRAQRKAYKPALRVCRGK